MYAYLKKKEKEKKIYIYIGLTPLARPHAPQPRRAPRGSIVSAGRPKEMTTVQIPLSLSLSLYIYIYTYIYIYIYAHVHMSVFANPSRSATRAGRAPRGSTVSAGRPKEMTTV